MNNRMTEVFRERIFMWVDRKNRPSNGHHLTRKNLFIFPSVSGFFLVMVIAVLWLLGTNYQNNLILALAFLLTSIFVVCILHTHRNLSDIRIEYAGSTPTFAGDEVEFIFVLNTRLKKTVENLEVGWQGGYDRVVNIDIVGGDALKVKIPQPATLRGWQSPGRLLIQSYFPLGILRCWTWLSWDVRALIYPEPVASPIPAMSQVDADGDGLHPIPGGEDYSGVRHYRAGDSLKHIAWKAYAQGKGLYSKEFSQNASKELWLDFYEVPVSGIEAKLSALCYWALQLSQNDEDFGLKIPGKTIAPGRGENHRRQVLEALAMCES